MRFKILTYTSAFIFGLFFIVVIAGESREGWHGSDSKSVEKHGLPLILGHGGPDEGGYYYIDSDDDAYNAPVFNWIDITAVGTPVDSLGDDEYMGKFYIGFEFPFYGHSYDSILICSNGWISFTSRSTKCINDPIPCIVSPNNLLAIWWDDLVVLDDDDVFYYFDLNNMRFIVSYNGICNYPSTGNLNFQVILYVDGTIIYQYGVMDPGSDYEGLESATVGIENYDGTIGSQYLYDQEGIHDSMAVYFGLNPPVYGDYSVCPTRFISPGLIGQVDDPISPKVVFTNIGGETVSFDTRLIIILDSIEQYNFTVPVIDLHTGDSITVNFPEFTPYVEGIYTLTAISELDNDEIPSDDTLGFEYQVFNLVYYEDFEANDGYYVGSDDWEHGIPTTGPGEAYSGINLWGTLINEYYSNGPLLSTLVSPPIALGSNPILSFRHWYYTEHLFDGGNVKVSTDEGNSWEILTPDDGYDGILSTEWGNPIGGEEAFFGQSNDWLYETFDLFGYAGSIILLRFDFGADSAVVTGDGWYIDDIMVLNGGILDPGWIKGYISDFYSGLPLDNAVVNSHSVVDTTGEDGLYILEIFPGTYSVTASADYYNPLTISGIYVFEAETTYQDFALSAYGIEVDTTSIDIDMQAGEIDTFSRTITNIGDGDIYFRIDISYDEPLRINTLSKPSFTVNPIIGKVDPLVVMAKKPISTDKSITAPNDNPNYEPPVILDFGDEITYFDFEVLTGDPMLLGVTYGGGYFWVSGGNGFADPNYLYKFDNNGQLVDTYEQGTAGIGWLDLTWDGQYVYGTDYQSNIINQFDPISGQVVGIIPNPLAAGLGLTYDPETDHFWGVHFWGSNIIEFDRNGEIINSFSQEPYNTIFGLGWDNASSDGPWLWVFAQEPDDMPLTIAQFNPREGSFTGMQFLAVNHSGDPLNPNVAGGASFTTDWDPTLGVFICLLQGEDSHDGVGIYEITSYSTWLRVSPMFGTIAPAESESLEIVLDLSTADIDTILDATIAVENNTSDEPVIGVHVDVVTGVEDENNMLPSEYSLSQNFPNPFNTTTEINFALPISSDVDISVYNVLGQKVATLVSSYMNAGYHKILWDASSVTSGIYFYKLSAGDYTDVCKMTLLK